MSITPGIHLKAVPDNVFKLILTKQREERDQRNKKINLSQAVVILLKEAYCKEIENADQLPK